MKTFDYNKIADRLLMRAILDKLTYFTPYSEQTITESYVKISYTEILNEFLVRYRNNALSDIVSECRYDYKQHILYIEFRNGSIYKYFNVPLRAWQEFLIKHKNAHLYDKYKIVNGKKIKLPPLDIASIGRLFWRTIRDRYDYSKIYSKKNPSEEGRDEFYSVEDNLIPTSTVTQKNKSQFPYKKVQNNKEEY